MAAICGFLLLLLVLYSINESWRSLRKTFLCSPLLLKVRRRKLLPSNSRIVSSPMSSKSCSVYSSHFVISSSGFVMSLPSELVTVCAVYILIPVNSFIFRYNLNVSFFDLGPTFHRTFFFGSFP